MASITKEFEFDSEKLQVVWAALTYLPEQGRNMRPEKRREEGKIIKKFKLFTEELRQSIGDGRISITRKLKNNEECFTIQLEQHEIELIRNRIDEYPFFQPSASDIISDIWDWLGAGKEIEKK